MLLSLSSDAPANQPPHRPNPRTYPQLGAVNRVENAPVSSAMIIALVLGGILALLLGVAAAAYAYHRHRAGAAPTWKEQQDLSSPEAERLAGKEKRKGNKAQPLDPLPPVPIVTSVPKV